MVSISIAARGLPTSTQALTQTCSNAMAQLVRVRSKEGNFRFELAAEDDIAVLVAKVRS